MHHLREAYRESRMAQLNPICSVTSVIPNIRYVLMVEYLSLRLWQLVVIGAIFLWLIIAQLTGLTQHLRALIRPFVLRHVESGVPVILGIQKCRHPWLDSYFGAIATAVSTPFYSLVLPLLFWHGQAKLGRQLTLLMATCIYVGNGFKDLVCASRPPSPVCRVTSSESEKKNSDEYGLPSSHTINIICFAGYVLHHFRGQRGELWTIYVLAVLLTTIVSLVIFGRLYLGMHSPIDIVAGCAIGASLLLGWCYIDEYLDAFISGGEYVVSFWVAIAILGLYAYPTPESPNPSFEDHTAFNGVALGIVSGVHRTFLLYHSTPLSAVSLSLKHVGMRTALGMVIIFAAKEGSKYLATIGLSWICYVAEFLLGFRFYSSSYVKCMRKEIQDDGVEGLKFYSMLKPVYKVDEEMDVDTGIRFVQYTTLGWAVVELAPHIFSLFGL